MKYKWRLPPAQIHVSPELLHAAGNRPLLAQMLALRGITDPDAVRKFLDPDAYTPTPPSALHDLTKGVDRIEQAIKDSERILVWGDFDVDGQTSTSVLVEALQDLGADVIYHIPIRATEGHGIRPDVLAKEIRRDVKVLLSCDTGIAAKEAVDVANAAGVDVVITDHHDLPDALPNALALINPKFHEETHPLYGLPGVGVAYKLIEELYARAGRSEEAHRFLDLTALGIVADLAHQRDDTRYLLQRGMDVLRSTPRAGLQAIMTNARMEPGFVNDESIGFKIGPRLNAVGRLKDANVSVPLLTTKSISVAFATAEDLEEHNRYRQYLTSITYESAIDQINKEPSLLQYAVLVLANPEWHQGVIGIVASRLVDEFGKPTILLAAPKGELARGSARSVDGYHITQAIASQEALLEGFGGHPMAAGLAVKPERIDAFRRGVSKAVINQRIGAKPEPFLEIATEISLENLSQETALELEAMAPFGVGNPPLNLLCRKVQIDEERWLGKDGLHRKLIITDANGIAREILWFNSAGEPLPEGTIDIVVRMRPSVFRGEMGVSITLQDYRVVGESAKQVGPEAFEAVHDLRHVEQPVEALEQILNSEQDLAIWGEAVDPSHPHKARMGNRFEVAPADALVLWTLPPGRKVLLDVIVKVGPSRLYVLGRDPALDTVDAFTRRLAGLVKYTMQHYDGKSTLAQLASAMAHQEETIKEALPILRELGVEAVVQSETGHVQFTQMPPISAMPDTRLSDYLLEARAFRRMFIRAVDLENYLKY